jgi:predicted alpha/beta hydrolase family esterase
LIVAALGWGAALLAQVLLGVWLTGLLPAGGASAVLALLVVVGLVVTLQLLFTAIGMLLAARSLPADPADSTGATLGREAAGRRPGAVRALASEAAHFAWIQVLMALEPWLTRRWDGEMSGRRPVLLVHGIFCNRAVWWRLRRRLLAAGFGPIVAVNLPHPGAAIESQIDVVWQAMRRLQAVAPEAPLTVVAHSLGGLVLRGLLARHADTSIARLLTVATPHHGSTLAVLCPTGGCKDLRPGSAWLLAHDDSVWQVPAPATSVYSLDDNLIGPRSSAHWQGARNVALRGVGHFGLITTDRGIRTVIAAIEAAA